MTALMISSGQTSSGITLNRGDSLTVLKGGTAVATTVNPGGRLFDLGTISGTLLVDSGSTATISAGGIARGTVLSGFFARQDVLSGGAASGTVIKLGFQTESGGVASGTVVSSGGFESVASGGVASDTVVSSGADQDVEGGLARGALVKSGGFQDVSFGGVARGTVVRGGGVEGVGSSGVVSGTVVNSGGEQDLNGGLALGALLRGGAELVSSGGVANGTVVSDGGVELVSSDGIASGAVLSSGGHLVVLPGGTQSGTVLSGGEIVSTGVVAYRPHSGVDIYGTSASNLVLRDGAIEYVLAGGSTSSSTVSSGGTEHVFSGGSVSGTVVIGPANEFVSSGGFASGVVLRGGRQWLGGIASGTIVSRGGQLVDGHGAAALDTVVNSGGGGFQSVAFGGVVSGTVMNDGIQSVFGHGYAYKTIVSSGASETIGHGGVAKNSVVESGGTVNDNGELAFTKGRTVFSGKLAGSGLVLDSGSTTLVLRGNAASFSGTETISGGMLVLTSARAAGNGTITFAGSGGTLKIESKVMPTNTIMSLVSGDTIDLAAIPFNASDSATYSGTTLSIQNGGTVLAQLALTGEPFASKSFALSPDASGGTDITTTLAVSAGVVASPHRDTIPATAGIVSGQLSKLVIPEHFDAAGGNSTLQGGSISSTAALPGAHTANSPWIVQELPAQILASKILTTAAALDPVVLDYAPALLVPFGSASLTDETKLIFANAFSSSGL